MLILQCIRIYEQEKIASVSGIPSDRQTLLFKGQVLEGNQPLSDFKLADGVTVNVVRKVGKSSTTASTAAKAPTPTPETTTTREPAAAPAMAAGAAGLGAGAGAGAGAGGNGLEELMKQFMGRFLH